MEAAAAVVEIPEAWNHFEIINKHFDFNTVQNEKSI